MVHFKNKSDKTSFFLTILLLAAFFCIGLSIFRDYGATPDEINQIEAGHITWNAISEKLGCPLHDFGNLPKLSDYYNRYYGQAVTFPTVLIEAVKHFSMDTSSIIRLRHIWNFVLFFIGTVCFGILTRLRFGSYKTCFLILLLYILTPRLFGDAFYNDRDALFVSLLWISLLAFEGYRHKPGIVTAILCAFFFALSINTRFFGLILLFLPMIRILRSGEKKTAIWLLFLTFAFWYLITPVFWGNFPQEFLAAFRLFSSGQQRTQETAGMAQILFLGKRFYENDLPFCYLPLWILISTPLIPQMLCLTGIICTVRKKRNRTDLFMLCFLLGGISTVMLIRPVLYNGWRHFYFFYVPFFWFAAAGLNALINHHVKIIQMGAAAIVCLSAIRTVNRITTLHPYEYIFLNQLVQDRIGDFDRDYWRLSTTECMEWIAATERDVFSVGEINSSLDNTLIGLMPGLRNKIHIINYNALHRYPADYLIFNYSGQTGNETYFPLYEPVYSIERDGVKLGEVFKRIASLAPEVQYVSPAQEIADGDFETQWCSDQLQNSEDTLLIEFTQPVSLQGLSLLPGDNEQEYARSPEIYTSIDGDVWDKLPITVSGLFDLSFPTTEARFIRIRNAVPAEFHWSIREILFY